MSTAISKAKTRFILNLNNRKRMAKAEQIPAIIKKDMNDSNFFNGLGVKSTVFCSVFYTFLKCKLLHHHKLI